MPLIDGEQIKCGYTEQLYHSKGRGPSDGIFFRKFIPQEKVTRALLMIHGLHEHSGVYLHVIKQLVEEGHCAVIAVDIHGHGQSEPRDRRGYIQDIGLFIQGCVELWKRETSEGELRHSRIPHFIFGHSLGGLISLHLTVAHPGLFNGALLSAPAIQVKLLPQAGWNRFVTPIMPSRINDPLQSTIEWCLNVTRPVTDGALHFLDNTFPKMIFPPNHNPCHLLSRRPGFLEKHMGDKLMIHGGIPVRTIAQLTHYGIMFNTSMIHNYKMPFLVMHGTDDGLADVKGSQRLHQLAPSRHKTLTLFNGFWHEILQEEGYTVVVHDMLQWMHSCVSDDPSASRSYVHHVDFFS